MTASHDMRTWDQPITDAEWAAADAFEDAWLNQTEPADAELKSFFSTAQQLAQSTRAFLPVPSRLQRDIARLTEQPETRPKFSTARWQFRRIAPLVGLAAVLALVLWFTPTGQRTFAALRASLNLGQVQVNVSPDAVVSGTSLDEKRETLASLAEARQRAPYRLLEPTNFPAGYALGEVVAVSYPGMPDWFPQPMYIETNYRHSDNKNALYDLTLRQFGVALGGGMRIQSLHFDATDVQASEPMRVGNKDAVMLTLGQSTRPVRELVWEQNGLMLELLSETLSSETMIEIAQSLK